MFTWERSNPLFSVKQRPSNYYTKQGFGILNKQIEFKKTFETGNVGPSLNLIR